MHFKKIQKTALFLITCVMINTASAQEVYNKFGNDPFTLDPSAVLEIKSTTRGFLPPRMTKVQRDSIAQPVAEGLQVWCTDCSSSGQLCVYLGTTAKGTDKGWATLLIPPSAYTLTTAGNNDAITDKRPIRESATSATISGTLVDFSGAVPTETGIVWREITDNEFGTFPVLNNSGTANFKKTTAAVTKINSLIKVTTPDLTSANPYYFRTYAKSSSGIGYGNAVIFNLAPPQISISPVTFTNRNTLLPVFAGKLTVNAGTLKGTITEYGYCSGTTNPPTVANDKVVLSNANSIALLNDNLNAETFTTNPSIDLAVNNYDVKTIAITYFRYYAVVKGESIPVYSDVVSFTPVPDPVTGGTAIATVIVDPISKPVEAGEEANSSFTVHFNVSKAGTHSGFTPAASTGATTNLTMNAIPAGSFLVGNDQRFTFTVSGLPKTSLDGCSFTVPGIGTLNTGRIQFDSTPILGNIPLGGNALCGLSDKTTVVPVFSPETGRIWMDRNLGASRAGTSKDDYLAFGCLYQWGRGNDGAASVKWTNAATRSFINGMADMNVRSDGDSPGSKFIPTNIVPRDWRSAPNTALWQEVGGGNNPCPTGGFRVPTIDELDTELVGVTNTETAYSSLLKLLSTPFIMYSGDNQPSEPLSFSVAYWSSTPPADIHSDSSYDVWFRSDSVSLKDNVPRAFPLSVRCIKN